MKVFVSSTVLDLEEERTIVSETLNSLSLESFVSEAEGADWKSSYEKCLSEIDLSDFYILIVGERYGFVPDKIPNDDIFDGCTSITHAEWKKAIQANKPMLIYIKTGVRREANLSLMVDHIEDFFAGYFRRNFSNSNELAADIRKDLLELITSIVRGEYRYPNLKRPTVVTCDDRNEVFEVGASIFRCVLLREPLPVIGLILGRTAGGIYDRFVNKEIQPCLVKALQNLRAFHCAEHFGVSGNSACSYQSWIKKSFYQRVIDAHGVKFNMRRIHFVPGTVSSENIESELRKYDYLISSHTIHLQLMGIAPNGQSMSVDPGLYGLEDLRNQETSLVQISEETRNYLMPRPPTPYCTTMGMGNVLKYANRIVLLAHGKDKADAIRNVMTTTNYRQSPCACLMHHDNFFMVLDQDSLSTMPSRWEEFFKPITATDFLANIDGAL